MAILLGPFDPLKMIFGIINSLLQKNIISYEEARAILKNSLNENLPDAEKEKILDSLIRRR